MFDTVVIATDGSESAHRGVVAGIDIARRFEAAVHALFVVDTDEIDSSPAEVRDSVDAAMRTAGERAIESVNSQFNSQVESAESSVEAAGSIETMIVEGRPAVEIIEYARDVDADVIALGTRGRHGEHAYLLGSVAEAVVRRSPIPVLTVRQLEGAAE